MCIWGNFTSSLLIWIHFISFYYLVAVATTYNSVLKRSGESWPPCFVPDFSGKAFSFSSVQLYWLCSGHNGLLLCWDIFPLYPHWLRAFCHEWMLNFVRWLFCICWGWSYGFVFSFVVIYHNDWFVYINHPCKLGMNLSWCMILFMCGKIQFANILLRIFASIFIKDIGL